MLLLLHTIILLPACYLCSSTLTSLVLEMFLDIYNLQMFMKNRWYLHTIKTHYINYRKGDSQGNSYGSAEASRLTLCCFGKSSCWPLLHSGLYEWLYLNIDTSEAIRCYKHMQCLRHICFSIGSCHVQIYIYSYETDSQDTEVKVYHYWKTESQHIMHIMWCHHTLCNNWLKEKSMPVICNSVNNFLYLYLVRVHRDHPQNPQLYLSV